MASTPVQRIRKGITHASPQRVRVAISELKERHFSQGKLLGYTNRYLTDTIKWVDKDTLPDPICIKDKDIAHYIATSTVLHCYDGWTFLSRGVEALLNGDRHSCIHMVYYAQLRAVMSIFANDGIGVFNRRHIWFNKLGTPDCVRSVGTHDFVREGFVKWARLKKKSNRILDVINVESISLTDWILAAVHGSGTMPITQVTEDWLESWGMDLKVLGKDHKLRNLASYRPQSIPDQPKIEMSSIVSSLSAFWSMLKPSQYGGFEMLDRYLLRNALHHTFRTLYGTNPTGNNYDSFVRRILGNLPRRLPTFIEDSLFDFLTSRTSVEEPVLFRESKELGLNAKRHLRPLAVLSRAILLLRLATALTADFLEENTVQKGDLAFWWDAQGGNAGLWNISGLDVDLNDLWSDLELVLSDVEDWLSNNPAQDSVSVVKDMIPLQLWHLSKFQLAGLWGILR